MKIVFATNNRHKLTEIKAMLGSDFEVLSLDDIGCHDDIPETAGTLEGNALLKAEYVYNKYGIGCFADDTGLEVDALDGAPGVFSARYAGGEGHDSEANMAKLLHNLDGKTDRKAHFRTVIALIMNPEEMPQATSFEGKTDAGVELPKAPWQLFEGRVDGEIIEERRGTTGFGYDPVFRPEGFDGTFAELGADIKNTISHRARAVAKLVAYLRQRSEVSDDIRNDNTLTT